MDWISSKESLPPTGSIVLVYIGRTPRIFEDDYTALVDGSDRTPEELEFRERTRLYYKDSPVQIASTYKSLSGKSWIVKANSDSRQGFISSPSDDVVTHWCRFSFSDEMIDNYNKKQIK